MTVHNTPPTIPSWVKPAGSASVPALEDILTGLLSLLDHGSEGHQDAAVSVQTVLDQALDLLARFDLGDWSAVDLSGARASDAQHDRHIALLASLARRSADQRLLGWHDRFLRYRELASGRGAKLKLPWKAGEPAGDNYHDAVARTYLAERVHQPIWQAEHDAVAHFLDALPKSQSVLDVPFGTGRFVPLYLERGMAATGVDISEAMLNEARRALGPMRDSVRMLPGNAVDLPFDDRAFDGVVCLRFLESIIPYAMVRPVLKEFRRVSRSWAIVRLNSRAAGLPPLTSPPDGSKILGTALHLDQLKALCSECGWELTETVVVGQKKGATLKGEQRVCLLRAIV